VAATGSDDVRRTPALSSATEGWLTGAVALLALLNVAPLLGWVFGFGAFSTWFVRLTLPALVALAVIVVVAFRTPAYERLRLVFMLGSVGGLLGTIGYDLFRVPFVLAGRQVLAPIESYGVLLLDASSSSDVTAFAGWSYHFANGICFGIAYAAVALGRSMWWAVLWALVLETATIVTPFATYYQLTGKWDVIAIAYAAHIPYGLALGWMTARPLERRRQLDEIGPWAVPAALLGLVVVLLVWLRPWQATSAPAGFDLGSGRFAPTWVRVPTGTCVEIRNTGDEDLTVTGRPNGPTVPAGGTAQVCMADPGVFRLGVEGRAWSGGYVISDPELPSVDPVTG
jgi:hypothetical protein